MNLGRSSFKMMAACGVCLWFSTMAPSSVVQSSAAAAEKSRILMLTQSSGYTHSSVKRPEQPSEIKLATAEVAMIQLGQKTDLFSVECTQDAAIDFTKENLGRYDIVMFYTTGALPISEADLNYFLNDWLRQKGHGFIGFHSATDTYGDYQPYWDMVGGTFNGHPWNSNNRVTITVHEPSHPLMIPFGEEFMIQDEIYQYKNWQPEKVRVLMSLNMAKCSPAKPWHVPVSWVKTYGDGRVYVNNLGHNESTWADDRFLKSVTAGIQWIRGDIDGEAAPNPELSAAQEALARSAAPEETK